MPTLDQCIVDACKAAWDESFLRGTPNRSNCSGFVKSVAQTLGVPLPAAVNADGIADTVASVAGWMQLVSGPAALHRATLGHFVLALLRGSDHRPPALHGHVGVIVGGPLDRGLYPPIWCGSLGRAQSRGDKSVGLVWNPAVRDNVEYWAYTLKVCRAPAT
jgi:hypothetical protein